MTNIGNSQYSRGNPNDGAGYFVLLVAGVLGAWALWSFSVSVLLPSLALAQSVAGAVLAHTELASLLADIMWGGIAGFIVGGLGWLRRRRSEAVDSVVDAIANREVVDAASLGWRYVGLYAAAGLVAGLIVGLLGLAFPTQLIGDPTGASQIGIAIVRGGAFGGGGGGEGGGLIVALLFLLLIVLPLLWGIVSVFFAAGVKGSASGAAGAVGKAGGLALFLALTRLRERMWLPKPEPSWPKPAALPAPGALDLDRVIAQFRAPLPEGGRALVDEYLDWLRKQNITPDAHAIGSNAPRYRKSLIYDLARRVNHEAAIREPGYKDPTLARWEEEATRDRKLFEERREQAIFGPGWVGRALIQGVIMGALTGFVSALLVAATFALT